MKKHRMSIEDYFFTRARLGRHWTLERARECTAFFGAAPYRFTPEKERAFMAGHLTDYNDNLSGLLLEIAA